MITDAKVSKICKAFVNGSSANIKFSKTQLSKTRQAGRSFGMFNPINTINTIKVLSKIPNKTEDLFRKVTFNDIIKTVDISKNLIQKF